MDAGTMMSAVWGVVFFILLVIVAIGRRARGGPRRSRPRRGGVGTGAAGAIYGLLNEDKQKAVDIIVEGQAESRRPEYPDGNLPDLEKPKR